VLNATNQDEFGRSVALWDDIAVVGFIRSGNDEEELGRAIVYDRDTPSANSWGQVAILEPNATPVDRLFGFLVATNCDYIAVSNHQEGLRFVYTFVRDEFDVSNWSLLTKPRPPNPSFESCGVALDMDDVALAILCDDQSSATNAFIAAYHVGSFEIREILNGSKLEVLAVDGFDVVQGVNFWDGDNTLAPIALLHCPQWQTQLLASPTKSPVESLVKQDWFWGAVGGLLGVLTLFVGIWAVKKDRGCLYEVLNRLGRRESLSTTLNEEPN